MVKRIRRKRSAKHTDKEDEAEQMQESCYAEIDSICQLQNYASPIRIRVPVEELDMHNECIEEEKEQEIKEKSPPPREIFKYSQNEEPISCNIYNLSPSAVEKRENMMKSKVEIKELETCNIIPQLLEMSQKAKVSDSLPILLTKSLSEGCDPFESVKRSLSNGTLQRDKIFSKIKNCNDVRIGGKLGSNFNPFIKPNMMSNHTASSSYERSMNEDENERRLLDYLDNYSAEVLQKTALVLLEKSLSRSQSFEFPMAVESATEIPRQLKFFERISEKNETLSEETSDFKPCNCRKSKCLKLYCECFSNGRKCTSKCDCSPCCNTPAHEELIAKAKDMIITRNPDAFKPKFNEQEEAKKEKGVKHQRGCNCQK